jgi:hypothetical protein
MTTAAILPRQAKVIGIAQSHAGCRARAQAWALKHGYRIVEGKEAQRKRA